MKCPKCNKTNTRKASKLAYIDGVYFCLECAIYFPSEKLKKELEKKSIQEHSKECIEKNEVAYNPADHYCICEVDT